MPVQRFRTFEDARRALWREPGEPSILQHMKRIAELARPVPCPRGVFRFRTIEDAKRR